MWNYMMRAVNCNYNTYERFIYSNFSITVFLKSIRSLNNCFCDILSTLSNFPFANNESRSKRGAHEVVEYFNSMNLNYLLIATGHSRLMHLYHRFHFRCQVFDFRD